MNKSNTDMHHKIKNITGKPEFREISNKSKSILKAPRSQKSSNKSARKQLQDSNYSKSTKNLLDRIKKNFAETNEKRIQKENAGTIIDDAVEKILSQSSLNSSTETFHCSKRKPPLVNSENYEENENLAQCKRVKSYFSEDLDQILSASVANSFSQKSNSSYQPSFIADSTIDNRTITKNQCSTSKSCLSIKVKDIFTFPSFGIKSGDTNSKSRVTKSETVTPKVRQLMQDITRSFEQNTEKSVRTSGSIIDEAVSAIFSQKSESSLRSSCLNDSEIFRIPKNKCRVEKKRRYNLNCSKTSDCSLTENSQTLTNGYYNRCDSYVPNSKQPTSSISSVPKMREELLERFLNNIPTPSEVNSSNHQKPIINNNDSSSSSIQLFLSQLILPYENKVVTRKAAKKADDILKFHKPQSQCFHNNTDTKNSDTNKQIPADLESLIDNYSVISEPMAAPSKTKRTSQKFQKFENASTTLEKHTQLQCFQNYSKTKNVDTNNQIPVDLESLIDNFSAISEPKTAPSKSQKKSQTIQNIEKATTTFQKNNILNVLKEVKIDYSTKGNTLTDFLEALTGPEIQLYNISKIGTFSWLEFAKSIIGSATQKRCKYVDICVDFGNIYHQKKKCVKLFKDGNIKVYRIDKNVIKKIPKQMDLIEHIDLLSQPIVTEEMFLDTVTTQIPISSSYVEQDDQSEVSSQVSGPRIDYLKRTIKEVKNDANVREAFEIEIDTVQVCNLIYQVFYYLNDAFNKDLVPRIKVRNNNEKNVVFEDGRLQLKASDFVARRINYNATRSRFKFCLILYILGKCYSLLKTGQKLTKREIFYQIKPLVRSQRQVDDAIQDVSLLLNVGPWHINIVTHHGLVYGDMSLLLSTEETINCNVPGTLIPLDVDSIIEIKTNAKFIMVVEKESIFHKLISEGLPNKLTERFITITGKGVPDFNTMLFLKKLVNVMSLPVFILVDADVYGIRIMMNYRFGSVQNCHLSQHLALPDCRWLGVFPSDIEKYKIKNSALTLTDRKMINKLVSSSYLASQPKIIAELQCLLDNNRKAAIEGLIKTDVFLSGSYLKMKFRNGDFI